MKSKKTIQPNYVEVIKLMKENKIPNPTWSQTWLYGSWKYYQKQLETNSDIENLESWWKGIINSYNEKSKK